MIKLRHMRERKNKFLRNSFDSQDYELLQDLATIKNNSLLYSKKLNDKKYIDDCFESKRNEDRQLEVYNEFYLDVYDFKIITKEEIEYQKVLDYKESLKDKELSLKDFDELIWDYIEGININIEDYLLEKYEYNIKTKTFKEDILKNHKEENCNCCNFNLYCKDFRKAN